MTHAVRLTGRRMQPGLPCLRSTTLVGRLLAACVLLLAVLLYLEGYFLESDTACMHPEKCFILLNAPEMAPGLINGAAPEVLAAFCRDIHYNRRLSPFRCYRHTLRVSEQLYLLLMEQPHR